MSGRSGGERRLSGASPHCTQMAQSATPLKQKSQRRTLAA